MIPIFYRCAFGHLHRDDNTVPWPLRIGQSDHLPGCTCLGCVAHRIGFVGPAPLPACPGYGDRSS